jgi:selenide, water dikinase
MDDAAVLRPGDGRILLFTLDVITPIVDDPRVFGDIAACNAMSDVYAMGGRPDVALSFLGIPSDVLGEAVVGEVLGGMNDACLRAGCAIVGGHSMNDAEPKCGLAVIGSVAAEPVWSQRDAAAGDALVLTKALGTGIVGQSIRAECADPDAVDRAIAQMTTLNDVAARVGRRFGVRASTDVTGFGLLGHLRHLVEASALVATIEAAAVPLLPGVLDLARAGCLPGGSRRNLRYAAPITDFADGLDEARRLVLADAQTSGGLLLALPEAAAAACVAALRSEGVEAAQIGGLEAGAPRIKVR